MWGWQMAITTVVFVCVVQVISFLCHSHWTDKVMFLLFCISEKCMDCFCRFNLERVIRWPISAAVRCYVLCHKESFRISCFFLLNCSCSYVHASHAVGSGYCFCSRQFVWQSRCVYRAETENLLNKSWRNLSQWTLQVVSAGAGLNEALHRTTPIGPQFSGDLSIVITLLNNDRLLVITVHEVFCPSLPFLPE